MNKDNDTKTDWYGAIFGWLNTNLTPDSLMKQIEPIVLKEIEIAREEERKAVDMRSGYEAGITAERERILVLIEEMKGVVDDKLINRADLTAAINNPNAQ